MMMKSLPQPLSLENGMGLAAACIGPLSINVSPCKTKKRDYIGIPNGASIGFSAPSP